MLDVMLPVMGAIAGAGVLSVGATMAMDPLAKKWQIRQEEERAAREKATQAEELRRARMRDSPMEYIQVMMASARAEGASLERRAQGYERDAEEAFRKQKDEEEQLGAQMPTTAERVKSTLMLVIWLIAATASVLLTYQLAFGITKSVELSVPVSLILVAFVEMGSFKMHALFEARKAGEVEDVKFRVSMIAIVTLTLLFICFAVGLSYIRADLIVTQELSALEANIEANNALINENEDTELRIQNAQLEENVRNLEDKKIWETVLFAFAEGVAVPLELIAGMVLPQFAVVVGHRRKIRELKAQESRSRKMALEAHNATQEVQDNLVVRLVEFCVENEVEIASIRGLGIASLPALDPLDSEGEDKVASQAHAEGAGPSPVYGGESDEPDKDGAERGQEDAPTQALESSERSLAAASEFPFVSNAGPAHTSDAEAARETAGSAFDDVSFGQVDQAQEAFVPLASRDDDDL